MVIQTKDQAEPVNTFSEWLLGAGLKAELGQKLLVTYSLLRKRHKETFDNLWDYTRDAFADELFKSGGKSRTITFAVEEDPELRVRELCAFIDASRGSTLEEFSAVIFTQASELYQQVQVWENKSLWQYFKWWVKRGKGKE